MTRLNSLAIGLLLSLLPPIAHGDVTTADTLDLSLEELMNVVVTSVSKKEQTLGETAAAVYVISAEEIHRSGATNIPEALRLAPGVQVSAIGQNKFAVSIRGFADRFANKLLVLVDGRSVYEPLFSGVFWEALDVPLENIARIEVIRGPGASIWGANAVNGVINIITKSPFDDRDGRVAVAAGTELNAYGYVQRRFSPDPDTAIVVHANVRDYDAGRRVGDGEGADDWRTGSAGFNLERLLDNGRLRVQGGVSRTRVGDELTVISAPPTNTLLTDTHTVSSEHLQGRWERRTGQDHEESIQAYLEHLDYQHTVLHQHRSTADLEYQQRLKLGDRHDVIWGLGYRFTTDHIDNSPMVAVSKQDRNTSLYSIYAQDEVTLIPARWRATFGARLEHNDYTRYVFQPNVRLLWSPNARNSAWLSLARAVRTPSRVEGGVSVYVQANPVGVPPLVPPSIVQALTPELENERLDALDFGWRHQLDSRASVDVAAFYYRYDNLRGAAMGRTTFVPTPFPGYVLVQTNSNNADSADVRGLEATIDWRPTENWRLQASDALLWMHSHTSAVAGQLPSTADGESPKNQFSLRSSLDLSHGLSWDAWLRYVSRIKSFNIPAFTTLDLRLAWHASKDIEISLVGQNLLDGAHQEFGSQFIQSTPSEVERGAYLKVDWKF
jgi:iron complex outermembrane receptor protein